MNDPLSTEAGLRRRLAEAEAALDRSEAQRCLLLDGAASASWEMDAGGRAVAESASWRAYTGQSPAQSLGLGWLDAIHPDDRAGAEVQWRAAVAAEREVSAEIRLRTLDGLWRWSNLRAAPQRDDGGAVRSWIGLAVDVDGRRRAELALDESGKRTLALNGAVDQGFCTIAVAFDAQGRATDYRFLEVSPAFEAQTGIPDATGRWMREIAPDHDQRCFDFYGRVAVTRQPARYEAGTGPLGRWWSVYAYPVGAPAERTVAVLFTDITARKRSEAAQRHSEERFRAVVTASSETIYRMSPDWTRIHLLLGPDSLSETEEPNAEWLDLYIYPADKAAVRVAIARAIQTTSMFELEHRVIQPDGSLGWRSSRAVPIVTESGSIKEWLGAATDITAAKDAAQAKTDAEAALRSSEARLAADLAGMRRLYDLHARIATEADLKAALEEILVAACELTGTDRGCVRLTSEDGGQGEIVAWRGYDDRGPFISRFRHEGLRQGWDRLRFERRRYLIEDVLTHPMVEVDREAMLADGVLAHQATPLVDRRGVALGVLSTQFRHSHRPGEDELRLVDLLAWTAADFIERHRAEAALRASEERFRAMADTAPVLIWELDESGLVFVSGHHLAFFGVGFEEIRGSNWLRFVHPDDVDAYVSAVRTAFDQRRPFTREARFRRADGQYRWLRNSGGPIGHLNFVGCSLDVTDPLEAQSALRESEERFAQFAASSSDALWIRDAVTLEMEYVSPAIEEIYGVRSEALLGDPGRWTALVQTEDRAPALAHLETARAGDAVVQEYRIRRPRDGALRWIRDTDFPLRDATGRVQRIGGIAKDVTDLKEAEAALTHSEQRLRSLVEGVPQLVWRAVDEGFWTWASPQWTAYTGQAEPDSHGRGWLAAVHLEDRAQVLAMWSGVVERGEFHADYRVFNIGEGRYRWLQTRAVPVRSEGGEVAEWLGASTDVDDLRRMQESQAVMVAELQHRTRNLIAVVRAIADDTMDETGPTEAFREVFADRLSALSRVQGLLSRSDAEPISIGTLVRLELDAIGGTVPGTRVVADGPDVFLRPSTVQTLALALHELATNARKYGALSHDKGQLAVTWHERIENGEARLAIAWVETGLEQASGRSPSAAPKTGYGRELIEVALPHTMGARTSYALTASGVHCAIDIAVRPGMGRSEP